MDDSIKAYRNELIEVMHKSQDAFEQQLSYISAGSLALSIGFIKDIIPNIHTAPCKFLLAAGWVSLTFTLLINCVSHILSAKRHRKTISEINAEAYDPVAIERRSNQISTLNWITVVTMVLGIAAIVVFIILNIYANG